MKAEPFVVSPKTYEPALNVLGVSVTVLASNVQTQGYEITLQSGDEGVGPPPHRHDWDESFFVLRGRVELSIDGKANLYGPGTLVHLPAGTVHGYRFGAGGGEMFEITGKGGNATRMFANISREVSPGPPDVPVLTTLLQQNGVTLMLG
ncbi:MAG TPA: cupin domain-containing protein [Burkholderiales bacterium]|nr:cupin domain-containing protein [Burkholderiales bacterium]